MHRLTRGPAPDCLARYQHGRDNWETLHQCRDDFEALRAAVLAIDGPWCAYCEVCAEADWHIEHLWPKSRYTDRTFAWRNLFLSCNRRGSCGDHKDKKGRPYKPSDLIDPGVHDPDAYLLFGADGVVHPREGLSATAERRARETIRVFNLNAPPLVANRADIVKAFLHDEPGVAEALSDMPPDDRRTFVCDFISSYCAGGFQSVVRHLLCV